MLAHAEPPTAALRAHHELLAYWSARKESGRLPSRAAIDPRDLKRLLPTVSLIDVRQRTDGRGACDYRLRLAGTGLYRVYGGEITGKALEEVYPREIAAEWRRELDAVVAGRRPAVGVHSFAWRGAAHLSTMWMRLPLAADGRRVDMILGYDAPIGSQLDNARSGIRAA
jgi:hypothetical protein